MNITKRANSDCICPKPCYIRNTFRGAIPRLVCLTVRRMVIERDGPVCQYCESILKKPGDITLDHVTPKRRGGRGTIKNLVVCCKKCNQDASGRTFDHFEEKRDWLRYGYYWGRW